MTRLIVHHPAERERCGTLLTNGLRCQVTLIDRREAVCDYHERKRRGLISAPPRRDGEPR